MAPSPIPRPPATAALSGSNLPFNHLSKNETLHDLCKAQGIHISGKSTKLQLLTILTLDFYGLVQGDISTPASLQNEIHELWDMKKSELRAEARAITGNCPIGTKPVILFHIVNHRLGLGVADGVKINIDGERVAEGSEEEEIHSLADSSGVPELFNKNSPDKSHENHSPFGSAPGHGTSSTAAYAKAMLAKLDRERTVRAIEDQRRAAMDYETATTALKLIFEQSQSRSRLVATLGTKISMISQLQVQAMAELRKHSINVSDSLRTVEADIDALIVSKRAYAHDILEIQRAQTEWDDRLVAEILSLKLELEADDV